MGILHILDLVIGLSFVYLLLSLICVALQEIKARSYDERSKNLKKWVFDTFNMVEATDKKKGGVNPATPQLGNRLWNNIIIDGLTQEGKQASYISKEIFVSALLDEIHYGSDDKKEKKQYKELKAGEDVAAFEKDKGFSADKLRQPFDFNTIRDSIETSDLIPNRMRRVMRQIHSESHGNIDSFRDRLERWFERAMERNAGTFKKKAQSWVLVFSIITTIALNVSSIKLIDYFYSNPAEAARVADVAEKQLKDSTFQARMKQLPQDSTKKLIQEIRGGITELRDLKLPIGWDKERLKREFCDKAPEVVALKVIMLLLGWAMTAIAVSLGAPFWYDTLNKLVDLRSAGKKPEPIAADGAVGSPTVTPNNTIG